MGKRDSRYTLDGQIELDEGFFTVDSEEYDADAPRHRERGSEAKAKVLVMAESREVEHPTRSPCKGKPLDPILSLQFK